MRFDIFQFIVPLTFLAIWALTSLFNREAQPLPARAGRGLGPGGPRPTPGPVGPRPSLDRRPNGSARDSLVRTSAPRAADPRASRGLSVRAADDEILIIEQEPRRPSPSSSRGVAASPRRGGRARTSAPIAPKKSETTARALSGSTSAAITGSSTTSMASQMGQPLALDPLVLPPSPLLSPGSVDTSKGEDVRAPAAPMTLGGADFQLLIRSRDRLRESFIMNEILQPPLALRGGHRPRR